MKTYKNLYPNICAWNNLETAYRKARRGKRKFESVASFEFNWESQLLRLQAELAGQTYQPGPYRSFYIHDPKQRLISAAPFRDRVVHHALCNLIEPIFERRFIFDSYANRTGKGTHRALDRFTTFARRYRYVLHCDIKQHFPAPIATSARWWTRWAGCWGAGSSPWASRNKSRLLRSGCSRRLR